MLSALLPGVREVRTPLITGFLWAASFWLLAGPKIAESDDTSEFLKNLALEDVPSTAWFAGAGIVAYLVGSLFVVRVSPFGHRGERARYRLRQWVVRLDDSRRPVRKRFRPAHAIWQRFAYKSPLSTVRHWIGSEDAEPIGMQAFDEWLRNEFQAHVDDGMVPVMKSFPGGCDAPQGFAGFATPASVTGNDPEIGLYETTWGTDLILFFQGAVKREKTAVEVRIQMKYPEVYAEIDRLRVEGEFRLSIFWPLTALIAVLGWAWSPIALVLLLIPPFLVRDGFRRVAEADQKLWETVMSGEVTAPIMDTMRQARDEGPSFDFAKTFPSFVGAQEDS